MLQRFIKTFGGDPNKREIEKTSELVEHINSLEKDLEALSDDGVRQKTGEFRARLAQELEAIQDEGERRKVEAAFLEELLPEAFAVVREAAKRTIGQRHYDVQLIGGVVLHQGRIAEMRTGEGKTLVATLPIYLNALLNHGTHLVTVNDYLARRDGRWMGAIYDFLGMSVGILQMAAVTENGKKAFLFDPEKKSPHEDQDQLRMVNRAEAYTADITYGTNSEFGFDYLRDNMVFRLEDKVQRGHQYAIVDEVDNVLIDEARTPLIISGPASGNVEWYSRMASLVRQLKAEDYEVSEKDRSVTLTEIGTAHMEQLLGQPLRDPDRPEDVTPEQAHLMGFMEQALRAQHLFKRNKDYLVQAGKVVIVDEFTGRLMPGRRWSDGLHQAVEAKEGVRVEPENVTYATITLQNYFRMYRKLAGMTGTALTEAEEFDKIYKLPVLPIPTNLEFLATSSEAPLVEVKDKDDDGYEYAFFSRREDPDQQPVFWRRKDFPDVIYRSVEAKLRSLVREIVTYHSMGRPLLVGTTSVESSERLSNRLRAEPVRRLMQIILLRKAWMDHNNREEDGRLIPELQPLNQPIDKLRPEDLRPMAKEFGLSLNTEEPANLSRLLDALGLGAEHETRLRMALQGGVSHQVLNARKHTEESQIIAGAGAFGAVTIATNMAGRGVDIKLGGDLAEEVIAAVARVLRKAGYHDPYDMSLEERRAALKGIDPALFGIYDAEVGHFLQYFDDMEKVRQLGGLHVIGSERHDARRIDNQLRGRAARQGDPGSSRFFLSLEDDLMRMFGGEQVKTVMERFRIDDDYPMQHRLVSNMIEQSQHRVEGANFDVRKHLLEYDDVLNSQRQRIYDQRNRVFQKEDLLEDVNELLDQEVRKRVDETVTSEEYWRLLAWLDQVQPPFNTPQGIFPSFSFKILIDKLKTTPRQELEGTLLKLAGDAFEAQQAYLADSVFEQLDHAGDLLKTQVKEMKESLDTSLDGMADNPEDGTRRPGDILDEISALVRAPLKLEPDKLGLLVSDPGLVRRDLQEQAEGYLTSAAITRLVNNFEFRLAEPLGIDPSDLQELEWEQVAGRLETGARDAMAARREKLLGKDGQITRDLASAMERLQDTGEQTIFRLLATMAQGASTTFDAKTHRQVRQIFTRLGYVHYAGQILAGRSAPETADQIMEHLHNAQSAQQEAWGQSELTRLGEQAVKLPARDIGRRVQNQIYRQVLLGAISELWVDYLTRVEALRVSIGLEAYAQSDPLVKYKSQASVMFQSLLADIRAGVISRIFLYQPRPAAVQAETAINAPKTEAVASSTQDQDSQKKRKRHRH